MENTCDYKECKLFELLRGTPEQCPNYQASWWVPEGKGKPILIKDCAPRRTFLMVQDLSNRFVGTQKASEQSRNKSAKVQAMQEALTKNLSIALTGTLNAIAVELKQYVNNEIKQVKKVLAIGED